MSRVPAHLASHFFLAIAFFFAQSAAADPPWVWRYNTSQTNYPTKGAALAAMHASSANAHIFTKERVTAIQDASVTYTYKAPPTSPEVKSDWRYTHQFVSGYRDTEEEIVAARQQTIQNAAPEQCPKPYSYPTDPR
jgi:hypothetical protein